MEDCSHDRIGKAARNRRRDNPGGRIGNFDRTCLCGRAVEAEAGLSSFLLGKKVRAGRREPHERSGLMFP